MMKKYSIYIIKIMAGVLFLTVYLSSCKDFLNVDRYFSNELKLDSVFAQKRYIEAYMWGTVALFPNEGQIYGSSYTPGPLATDEALTLWNGYPGMQFVLGEITRDNLGTLNTWGNLYKIIRKCNTILARIDEASDWTASERLRVVGYTRFYRAYAYYQLLVDFGPPILLGDEILETNEVVEYYDRPRSTYDEAMEYICSEFEQAALLMPVKVSIMDFGRPTKGAAYGLVARLRLIHASPLFNGGQAARTYFSNWTRKTDGVHYVRQNDPDRQRWAIAAAAAKRVIDLTDAGTPLYKLYTVDADEDTPELPSGVTSDPDYYNDFPNGAAKIDPFKSYSDIFTGEAVAVVNPELVWGRRSSSVNNASSYFFPASNGGTNGICIPQKIIDAYKMVDGRTIDNASVQYPYTETGFSSGAALKNFSGYRFTPSGEVSNMYVNREARFYASIGFSECYWPCESTTDVGQYNFTVTYYYGSPNGKDGVVANPLNYPLTGYVLKKTVHRMDARSGANARIMDKACPIIRYAEILLSYAEALNNLAGESFTVEIDGQTQTFTRDVNEIKKAFNQVRYRAGLPGLSTSELADPNLVQQNIETERMIEFLHENRRYYDVRRWGIYEETENTQMMGMNTDSGKEGFYQRVVPNSSRIGSRIVNKRLVFVPVPNAEIKRLPSLDQNPGW
jgi:hypothetical protein